MIPQFNNYSFSEKLLAKSVWAEVDVVVYMNF